MARLTLRFWFSTTASAVTCVAALACSVPVHAADGLASAQPATRAKHYPALTFLVGEYRDWQETATTLAGTVTTATATWHEPVNAIAFDGTMNLLFINVATGASQENDLIDPVGNKLLRTYANSTFCSYSPAGCRGRLSLIRRRNVHVADPLPLRRRLPRGRAE